MARPFKTIASYRRWSPTSPFPLLHHLRELLKQVMGIVRSWRCFGVILHAEQRQISVPQAFQCLVVQVDVCQLDFALGQRIGIHREIVIVRGNLDLAGLQLLYWMIPAMVSKL